MNGEIMFMNTPKENGLNIIKMEILLIKLF